MQFQRHLVRLAILAVCLMAVPAKALDVGLDLSVATQIPGEEISKAKMTFLHLQTISKFHTNLEWINEFTVGRLEVPEVGYVIGINEIARISILGAGKTSPFVDLGVGVNHFGPHEHLWELDGPSQFSLIGGVGFRFRPKNSILAYVVEYRVKHFSNAGTMGGNQGLNLHAFSFGFNFLPKAK